MSEPQVVKPFGNTVNWTDENEIARKTEAKLYGWAQQVKPEAIKDVKFFIKRAGMLDQFWTCGVRWMEYGEIFEPIVRDVVYPKNWFEHLKQTVLPKWLKGLWPVKYTKATFKVSPKLVYDQLPTDVYNAFLRLGHDLYLSDEKGHFYHEEGQ